MKSNTPEKPDSRPEPSLPTPLLRRQYRLWDAGLLAALLVGLLALRLFGVPDDGGSVTLGGRDLPGVCAYHQMTGASCPGCGMSRALVLLAHGEFRRARRATPAAWPMAVFIAAQLLWRLGHLLAGVPWARYWQKDVFLSLAAFYAALVIPWFGRLFGFW